MITDPGIHHLEEGFANHCLILQQITRNRITRAKINFNYANKKAVEKSCVL